MPILATCVARIRIGRAKDVWTAIQAENASDAKDLLKAMYGDNKVMEVHEMENTEVKYYA